MEIHRSVGVSRLVALMAAHRRGADPVPAYDRAREHAGRQENDSTETTGETSEAEMKDKIHW